MATGRLCLLHICSLDYNELYFGPSEFPLIAVSLALGENSYDRISLRIVEGEVILLCPDTIMWKTLWQDRDIMPRTIV